MQFGPNKKFGVLYCLDLRKWLSDTIVLWRVNLTSESVEFQSISVNNKQTLKDQCKKGRRPHITWNRLFSQIEPFCVKVYEGSFEDIFSPLSNNSITADASSETTGTDTALPAKLYNLPSDNEGSL